MAKPIIYGTDRSVLLYEHYKNIINHGELTYPNLQQLQIIDNYCSICNIKLLHNEQSKHVCNKCFVNNNMVECENCSKGYIITQFNDFYICDHCKYKDYSVFVSKVPYYLDPKTFRCFGIINNIVSTIYATLKNLHIQFEFNPSNAKFTVKSTSTFNIKIYSDTGVNPIVLTSREYIIDFEIHNIDYNGLNEQYKNIINQIKHDLLSN